MAIGSSRRGRARGRHRDLYSSVRDAPTCEEVLDPSQRLQDFLVTLSHQPPLRLDEVVNLSRINVAAIRSLRKSVRRCGNLVEICPLRDELSPQGPELNLGRQDGEGVRVDRAGEDVLGPRPACFGGKRCKKPLLGIRDCNAEGACPSVAVV